MKPLYFPFTTISEPVLGALLACFKQVAVYQPSRNHVPESFRNWEAGGRLQIRLPDEDKNDPLPHLLKEYKAWAELHEGERPDFEKFRPPQPSFTDVSATSRIRSEIRKTAEGAVIAPSQEGKEDSILLRARLFLTMAQEHDQLRQALEEDLIRIAGMEKVLFRNLLADQDGPLPKSAINQPAEEAETAPYMSAERITAWARLHVHYRKSMDTETVLLPETPEFLITSDQSALDQLLEQTDEVDTICSVSGIPFGSAADLSGEAFFNEQRCKKLGELAAQTIRPAGWDTFFTGGGSEAGNTGRLTIYRVKGDAIADFLSGSGHHTESSRIRQDTDNKQYTLAGSIVKKDR